MGDYFFNAFLSGVYSAPTETLGVSVNDEPSLLQSSHVEIYKIYDELEKEFPNFVKKTVIAKAFSREIRRYTIRNYELTNLSNIPVNPFKICIIASLHGYEQGSAWTTAQFFRLLLKERDEKLSFIFRNVCFEVIPVANPWGFDKNERKNKNGVDLNRNFAPDFRLMADKNDSCYGGEYPESELETQAIVRFIEENLDAKVILDYHNIAKGYPLFYVYGQRDVQLANAVFTALTGKWTREYAELPKNEILGLVRPNGGFGMLADHVLKRGLWILTMETPWCMPVIGKEKYDAPTIRCAIDVLANTVLAICKNG